MDMGISVNGDATTPALVCLGLIAVLLTTVLAAHSLRLLREQRRGQRGQRGQQRPRVLVGRDTWGTAAQQELVLDGGSALAAFLPGLPPAAPAAPAAPSGTLSGKSGADGSETPAAPTGGPDASLNAEEGARCSVHLPAALAHDRRVNPYKLEAMRLIWRDAHDADD